MKDGIAARFGSLDNFMIVFSRTCTRWTQTMTTELCRLVPKNLN